MGTKEQGTLLWCKCRSARFCHQNQWSLFLRSIRHGEDKKQLRRFLSLTTTAAHQFQLLSRPQKVTIEDGLFCSLMQLSMQVIHVSQALQRILQRTCRLGSCWSGSLEASTVTGSHKQLEKAFCTVWFFKRSRSSQWSGRSSLGSWIVSWSY